MSFEETAPKPRPRVLVLTPRFPYPVIGGDRLRIFHICKALAPSCSLTLLSLCDAQAEMDAAIPDDGVFDQVERVYLPRWRSAFNALLALPGRTPLQVAYYQSAAYRRKVQQQIPNHDVCLAHLIRTGDYVRTASLPRVLEMTDAISLNYQRVKALSGRRDLKSRIYSLEADRLQAYERRAIEEFDAATLVSSVDRDFLLAGRDRAEVMVCSNGVDLSSFPYAERENRERTIVFIGNMTTVQNLDACNHFIEAVLPLLRRHGDFKLRIIGRIQPSEVLRFEAVDGVEVRANVASVPDATGNAFAAIAPMRLGAGVQNKILEYFAMGLPTITSPVGLEGLHAVPGVDVLVADEPPIWVEHLLRLWQYPQAAQKQSRAGRAYVERAHAWEAHLAPLTATIHRLATRK